MMTRRTRTGLVLVGLLIGALLFPLLAEQAELRSGTLLAPLQPAAHAPLPGFSAAPPPAGMALDFADYPSSQAIALFVHQLAAQFPDLVQVIELGYSHQGRPLLALRAGSSRWSDPDTRPALLIDGQHHAREPIGQQAVLYFVWHLVSTYGSDPLSTHLLDTRTVYAFPCVNPDGNDVFLETHYAQRKNLRPTDDDGDGRIDEDYPQGMAGWSVFQVYEVRFNSWWLARHRQDPFVGNWQRFGRASGLINIGLYDVVAGRRLEQVDLDGDGKIGEDLPGGVDLNRNYPVLWTECSADPASVLYRGPEPFSEPETAAVRDLMLAHPNIRAAISYHSGDDRLAMAGVPGGLMSHDEELYERMGIKASQLTEAYGYTGTRHQHATVVSPGETRSWQYSQGILAWLVEAYLRDGPIRWNWVDEQAGRAWAYYHTGLRFNPPPGEILAACRRWLGYNLYTLAALPTPRTSAPRLEGRVLSLAVHNDGLIPVAVTVEITVGEDAVASAVLGELSAGGLMLHVRLTDETAARLGQGEALKVRLEAGGASRQHAGTGLTSSWEWVLSPETTTMSATTLAGPPPGEYRDLGAAFGPGGWDADPERWDNDYYHFSRMMRGPALQL